MENLHNTRLRKRMAEQPAPEETTQKRGRMPLLSEFSESEDSSDYNGVLDIETNRDIILENETVAHIVTNMDAPVENLDLFDPSQSEISSEMVRVWEIPAAFIKDIIDLKLNNKIVMKLMQLGIKDVDTLMLMTDRELWRQLQMEFNQVDNFALKEKRKKDHTLCLQESCKLYLNFMAKEKEISTILTDFCSDLKP